MSTNLANHSNTSRQIKKTLWILNIGSCFLMASNHTHGTRHVSCTPEWEGHACSMAWRAA